MIVHLLLEATIVALEKSYALSDCQRIPNIYIYIYQPSFVVFYRLDPLLSTGVVTKLLTEWD